MQRDVHRELRSRQLWLLTALGLACLPACNDTVVVGELEEVVTLKAVPNPNLDILFVVDNSASMIPHQEALARNFPLMMDRLAQLDGGLPNIHVGVITSDMGTSGSASTVPGPSIGDLSQGGCAGIGDDGILQHANAPELSGTFISDVSDGAGGRIRNYTGELHDVFAQIALVNQAHPERIAGCGFEQHLAAMRRGLANPANADFIRADANLAIVIIADEDDCSVGDPAAFFDPADSPLGPLTDFRCTRHGVRCAPDMDTVGFKSDCEPRDDSTVVDGVQPFVDALVELKGDARKVMVAGIVGDPAPFGIANGGSDPALFLQPSCTIDGSNGPESANPAVRLSAFLDAFPGRSQLTSICSPDLSSPLSTIGDTAKKLLGDPCLDTGELADISALPGVQPACEVFDVRDSAPKAPLSLPACAPGGTDCYELAPDPVACPASGDHLRLRFRRTSVTDDTWTSVRCQRRS